MDHTSGAGGTARVTGRRQTGECAGAACLADALPVGARTRAAAVRFARHVAGGRLAGEVARASAAAGARAIRANGLAAGIVSLTGRMAGRCGADEPAVVARWAGAGSIVTASVDGTAGGQYERQAGQQTGSKTPARPRRHYSQSATTTVTLSGPPAAKAA
jgi:hypothetical protein